MLLPSDDQITAELCRRSLAEFVRESWKVIEPSTELVWNWHIDVICDHVQALLEDRLGAKNLIINVPPGSMKSTVLSVCAPAWMWTTRPGWRGLFASGNEGVALRDSMKCRDILESDWYRRLFRPEWEFAKDQNAKSNYRNTLHGFRRAISAGSRITGDRADDIFVDDPNDATGGKAERDAVIQWWDDAAYNRLSDMTAGHRCIIQQRLHEEDLTGHVLATDRDAWAYLVIRQEYEKPGKDDPDFQPTPLGWVDPRTSEGELFFPQRFPASVIASEKRVKGSSGYAGQHQQRPAPKEGAIFKKGYVRFYKQGAEPKFRRRLLSADTAFKEKQSNDNSVILAAGECREEGFAGIYLLDRWKDQVGYPELKAKAKTMGAKWSPEAFLVEDKASGQSLIQELKRDTLLPIVAVQVDRDKVERANAATPSWEAGIIFVPEDAPWVDDFLENLYGFPKLAHDDDVDAFTQLVLYVVNGMGIFGVLEAAKKQKAEMEASRESMNKVQVSEANGMHCPKCDSLAVSRLGAGFRCGQCGNQWPEKAMTAARGLMK
jgi:predicted phage terminase large subunit-like protein